MVSRLGELEGLQGKTRSEGATSIQDFMPCLISFAIAAINCINQNGNELNISLPP
ncbi:hypothetical protein G2W53_037750 [Senna tora]|uniref:Uncharacterized protein n=1 Tax=Senna tora TaxID=362788 RepID=A0A834SY33_9FABA|nr:hypothetical protein G2W53_037750 [Senna tora]